MWMGRAQRWWQPLPRGKRGTEWIVVWTTRALRCEKEEHEAQANHGYGLRFGHEVKRQPGSGMLSVLAVSASELACPEDLPEPGCIQTSLAA